MRIGLMALGLAAASIGCNLALAKERIYLLAGQSNMMGRGKTQDIHPMYRSTPSNVRFYYQGRPRKLAQFAFFGPEVAFAHEVARAFPNDRHIIIKAAGSGSSIQDWLPGRPLHNLMMRQLDLAVSPNRQTKLDAVVWMQGERDAKNYRDAIAYQHNFSEFAQSVRQELRAPNSLFVVGRVNPKARAFRMLKTVQDSQAQAARSVPNTVLVNTEGLGTWSDKVHYNAQGQLELGRRMAQAYIARRR